MQIEKERCCFDKGEVTPDEISTEETYLWIDMIAVASEDLRAGLAKLWLRTWNGGGE